MTYQTLAGSMAQKLAEINQSKWNSMAGPIAEDNGSNNDGNDRDAFRAMRRHKQEMKIKKREAAMKRFEVSGLVYRNDKDGEALYFDCPRVAFYPGTHKCRDFRINQTCTVGPATFIKWMTSNFGNNEATPVFEYLRSKRRTPKTIVLDFGKHKGEKITDIPSDYLEWMSDCMESLVWQDRADKELARREELEDSYE